jgi:predicted MFS family arabinose efflux permease
VGLVVVAPIASLLVEAVGRRGAFVALALGLVVVLLVAAFLMADDPARGR